VLLINAKSYILIYIDVSELVQQPLSDVCDAIHRAVNNVWSESNCLSEQLLLLEMKFSVSYVEIRGAF
jgi:hypothetical protein